MEIFLLENRLDREGDRINVGLALIYMGLLELDRDWMRLGREEVGRR